MGLSKQTRGNLKGEIVQILRRVMEEGDKNLVSTTADTILDKVEARVHQPSLHLSKPRLKLTPSQITELVNRWELGQHVEIMQASDQWDTGSTVRFVSALRGRMGQGAIDLFARSV